MIQIFDRINPILLDVVVIVLLVLTAFFGAIKGIKKTGVDFSIVIISLFLGFCPWTKSVKDVLSKAFFAVDKILPAGSSELLKFAYSLVNPVFSALIFSLLIYVLLHVILVLIDIISRRKRKDDNIPSKSVVSRVFGGIVSLLYGGAFMIVVITALDNNVAGMSNMVSESKVTKSIVRKTGELISDKNDKLVNKVVLKIYSGDFMAEIDDETVDSFVYLNENYNRIVENKKYTGAFDEDTLSQTEVSNLAKERIADLNAFSVLSVSFGESRKEVKTNFAKVAESVVTVINRAVKESGVWKLEYPANDIGVIEINLEKAGVGEKTLELLKEITVGK